MSTLLRVQDHVDPIFGWNIFEIVLAIIVLAVCCAVVSWAWRTFKP